jgi:hypothetical protein
VFRSVRWGEQESMGKVLNAEEAERFERSLGNEKARDQASTFLTARTLLRTTSCLAHTLVSGSD